MNAQYDVVIVGGGIVGLVTALGLTKQTELKIALIDSQPISSNWSRDLYDHRVSAISLASQRIFKNLTAWESIQSKRASPYTRMFVWDERAQIQFDNENVYAHSLGFIIEDKVMRTSLVEALQATLNVDLLFPIKLAALEAQDNQVQLITEDGQSLTTKLIVGADGAHSWVRSQCCIQLDSHDYHHSALIAQVNTALPHAKTAWQRFTSTGSIAFLPLIEPYCSSIVWSAPPEEINKLMQEENEKFKKTLANAFENRLGDILKVDTRYHYPLKMRHAKNYVLPRIALVGDAAHTLHPLAGQGVNLGLLDAACLVHVIADALFKHRDFSALHTLRKYERWRKGNNLIMLQMVGLLKNLFMNEKNFVQSLRSLGLKLTDRASFLKKLFANHAVGNQADLPELAK